MKNAFETIKPFLTKSEIEYLLQIDAESPYHRHLASQTGRPTAILAQHVDWCFGSILLKFEPFTYNDWHIDGQNKRHYVVIHPLTPDPENYVPGNTEDGMYYGPVLLNTKREHAVFNNEFSRTNLQIPFREESKARNFLINKIGKNYHRENKNNLKNWFVEK